MTKIIIIGEKQQKHYITNRPANRWLAGQGTILLKNYLLTSTTWILMRAGMMPVFIIIFWPMSPVTKL